jgi:hypothetical protein
MNVDSTTGAHAAPHAAPSHLAAPAEPDVSGGGPHSVRTRRDLRLERSRKRRSQRGLGAAIVVSAGVPLAVVLALWSNLNLPFWFNEQWRSYYIAAPGDWWATLGANKAPSAPFPAGWFILERYSAALFGSTELVMRLTTAVFLPIGCVLLMLLARRWMPLAPAVVTALVASLTGTLLVYAVQLSEYVVDATAVIAILLLHEIAGDADQSEWRSPKIYLSYAGIALACVMSIPAIFIVAPILLLDAVRALRARAVGPRLAGAAGAGLVVLIHLRFFVVPQSALTKSAYWDVNFMPHSGVGNQAAFLWDGLRGFVTGTLTASDPGLPTYLSARFSWILTFTFTTLLVFGLVTIARSARGRSILVGIGGSLVLTAVASYIRYWPFGFVRTNFYLVPVLFLVAGIGAARSALFLTGRIRDARAHKPGLSPVVLLMIGLAVVVATAGVLSVVYEAGSYRQLRESVRSEAIGIHINAAVGEVKHRSNPQTALVVVGWLAVAGWQYYQYEYSGNSTEGGYQIPPSDASFTSDHGSPVITRFVRRVNPTQVFLYTPYGASVKEIEADIHAVQAGQACDQPSQTTFYNTGLLYQFSCTRS